MLQALDGPSKQDTLVVTDAAVSEVKVGASVFPERKVVTLQSDAKIYVYFADEGETPSVANVQAKGFWQVKNVKESYEASDTQAVFILSFSGNANVVVAERA